MAKRKSSLPNRVANLLLLLLAFKRPIELAIAGNIPQLMADVTLGATSPQGFSLASAKTILPRMYGPVIAAFVLFEIKKMAMKKFRF